MKVVLDPGHGGHDSGAVGPAGLRESAVVLQVALAAAVLLRKAGHDVRLTREADRFVSLDGRAQAANAWGADLFIALHCNSVAGKPEVHGIEVWTSPGQTLSDRVAQICIPLLGVAFPGEPIRKDLSDGDDDKESPFRVLIKTRAPAVLLELGFISHPPTEQAMRGVAWIGAAALAVVWTVQKWAKEG